MYLTSHPAAEQSEAVIRGLWQVGLPFNIHRPGNLWDYLYVKWRLDLHVHGCVELQDIPYFLESLTENSTGSVELDFLPGIACLVITPGALLLSPDTWFRPLSGLAYALTVETSFPNLHQTFDRDTEQDLYWIASGFHGALARDEACKHGQLTPSDTCSVPMLQLLRPVFSEHALSFSTFQLKYASVLSRYCYIFFHEKYNLLPHVWPKSIYIESQVVRCNVHVLVPNSLLSLDWELRSSACVDVKLFATGASGRVSRPRLTATIKRTGISCLQVTILLKYRESDVHVNPQNNPTQLNRLGFVKVDHPWLR